MRNDHDLGFMLRYENVAWFEGDHVRILDRRIYPREIRFVECYKHEEVAQAIADMVTQSAGPYTAAGMGMILAYRESLALSAERRWEYLKNAAYTLSHARPTTVHRMTQVVEGCLKTLKQAEQQGINGEEALMEYNINQLEKRYGKMEEVSKHLVKLFKDGDTVMTQCFGETIVGMMIRTWQAENKDIKMICPETRPFLQGGRLTASVAADMDVDVTVITDNMVGVTMSQGKVDVFTSAADSIVLDGHVVNKVGTMQMAIVAKYFGIPYFVTGIPDRDHKNIDDVVIEERDPEQVLSCHGVKHTHKGVKGYYPSFDITPPHLVSGVVTDQGVFAPYTLKDYFELGSGDFYL